MRRIVFAALTVMALLGIVLLPQGSSAPLSAAPADRGKADTLYGQGNWKEAYDLYSVLATDAATDARRAPDDLSRSVDCLQRLGRIDEIDAVIEKAVAAHRNNWRVLYRAAQLYFSVQHDGFLIAGKFQRGPHRGGGKWANSYERDRARGMQLMVAAMEKIEGNATNDERGSFYSDLANQIAQMRGYGMSWRFQILTDLDELPDYNEGGYGYYGRGYYGHRYYGYGGETSAAPVNADGSPILYGAPKSWTEAKNDGERWRWALARMSAASPNLRAEELYRRANFLQGQFGVETVRYYGWFGRALDDDPAGLAAPYQVHTLKDEETLARLATGISRFTLPDEHNPIKLYQELVAKHANYNHALNQLASIMQNRRQYDRAADLWKQAGATDNVKDILGNWGVFQGTMTQPAGKGASVEFRFRNATSVTLQAYSIQVEKLLGDVKTYLKGNPKQLDWQKSQIENIGWRLVEDNQQQYIGGKVAEWKEALTPRALHFDKVVTLNTPLKTPGAYLLVATLPGGNVSRIVVWVADTVIVKKPLDGKLWYYVADAVTGTPINGAKLNFFGYRQRGINEKDGRYRTEIDTAELVGTADADGQFVTLPTEQKNDLTWLITASKGDRFAYLGFTGAWYGRRYDEQYNQVKVFAITDRPAYRPDQPVKFKFWANYAKYDQDGKSAFAGKPFTVYVTDPKGEQVFTKACTADDFGGFDGEFTLPKDATLGMYYIRASGGEADGGGSFRVEEYKKPEFEVLVEAPGEPVRLGEVITAKIKANYYFGAPVTEAKVKYKVMRTPNEARWYPTAWWDWFYGEGYWWYAYDYTWYPGWREWGCPRPIFSRYWWGHGYWGGPQPEVVAEAEVPIGKDGTVDVKIDTALIKALQGSTDHKYEITAEVTDNSRRTIVGSGNVIAARKPFKVYAWVNRGHYRPGDTVQGNFQARTVDGRPVKGTGDLSLLKLSYPKGTRVPVETEVQHWDLNTDADGQATLQMKAEVAGQYRLRYRVTDVKGHTEEGGYVFAVRGDGFDPSEWRFNDIELVPDKQTYQPGENVNLAINTNRVGSTVLLFVRPASGVYLPPKVLRLDSMAGLEQIAVIKKDMPNFFVEAVTVANGEVHTDMREIVVPPESRALNVEVTPAKDRVKPGEATELKVKLTDPTGKPFQGSTVVSMYDKALEYISGGSNVPAIKEFYWKWRRYHYPNSETSLRAGGNINKSHERPFQVLGVFGDVLDEADGDASGVIKEDAADGGGRGGHVYKMRAVPPSPAPMRTAEVSLGAADSTLALTTAANIAPGGGAPEMPSPGGGNLQQPMIRSKFADSAFWAGTVNTDAKGEATIRLTMPENLTTWKTKVWAMGAGTAVGEGVSDIITTKNLIIRLQAPRFFTQTDEVVLSANVHNYLATTKTAKVVLELEGGALGLLPGVAAAQTVTIEPKGEKRVDWRVKVLQPGTATVRMKALTDEESDAMEQTFPVYVHGMLKMESFSGALRPIDTEGEVKFVVPAARKPEQSRIEIRYSPTLAGAMVDALPYLVDYPYGCTEQTLNRFVPTVLTQNILKKMGLNLKDIQEKRTNLNAQEIGDDKARAGQWKRFDRNPVFDEAEVAGMVKFGVNRLASMQCADGGWGWFSGYGEQSYPHTTAVVVHGLQVAKANGAAVDDAMIARGIEWLANYQAEEVRRLQLPPLASNRKGSADVLDALVYMILVDAGRDNMDMRNFLYRDRLNLTVYGQSMFGIALHKVNDVAKRDMVRRNIEQYLVQDEENQTAYLKLPGGWSYWWYWWGSEYEAHAYYLKLLAAVDPNCKQASRLVKYLLNNRKNATYWNSTRDTAVVLEAFADYWKASGEDKPDMTVEVQLDGKTVKTVKIDRTNLFTYDNKVVLEGAAITDGPHTVTMKKTGTGPLYFNAYVTNFTLEDFITKAGLEVKVNRQFFKLVPKDKTVASVDDRGNPFGMKVEKYERVPLENGAVLKSGDLVEVELTIDSKNDYEYLLFEDMKASGFEPVEFRSGYTGNEMGAYVEFRDERVCFFVRWLARGQHSLSYRLRAEIPGTFSALPAKASAMYAPELRGNSDEMKVGIMD